MEQVPTSLVRLAGVKGLWNSSRITTHYVEMKQFLDCGIYERKLTTQKRCFLHKSAINFLYHFLEETRQAMYV